jgi:hypothetical protein
MGRYTGRQADIKKILNIFYVINGTLRYLDEDYTTKRHIFTD